MKRVAGIGEAYSDTIITQDSAAAANKQTASINAKFSCYTGISTNLQQRLGFNLQALNAANGNLTILINSENFFSCGFLLIRKYGKWIIVRNFKI